MAVRVATTPPSRSKAMPRASREDGALDRLQGFASEFGPAFYGLPVNTDTVTLERAPVTVPERIGDVVPFHAGETLGWRFLG